MAATHHGGTSLQEALWKEQQPRLPSACSPERDNDKQRETNNNKNMKKFLQTLFIALLSATASFGATIGYTNGSFDKGQYFRYGDGY